MEFEMNKQAHCHEPKQDSWEPSTQPLPPLVDTALSLRTSIVITCPSKLKLPPPCGQLLPPWSPLGKVDTNHKSCHCASNSTVIKNECRTLRQLFKRPKLNKLQLAFLQCYVDLQDGDEFAAAQLLCVSNIMGLKKSHSDGNGSISHVAAPSGDEDQANFVMGQIKKVICPWGISKDKLMKSLDSCWLACGLSQGNTADDLPKGEVDQKDERSRGEKTFQKVDTNSSDHGKKRKRDETDDCFQEDEAEVDHTSGGMIPNEHTSPESTVGGKFRNRNEPKGVTESVKLQKMSQTMEREQCGKSPDGDRFGDSLNKIPWITQDSSSSRLPTPSLAVDQPPSSTVPPPLFSNQCSSRSVPLPTPSPSPSWPRQTGSLERVTQHARANKVVQTSNKVSLAHVRLGGCTSSGKNFLLPDDAVNNRSKSAHFPRVGDILEAGFYRASSACIHCKRKGIICTFGTGISKSNKLRRPGLARCDYCPVIKRKCIFTTGVESVENKAQKVSDSMSIKPCLAMNGNVVTKPSHLLNGDRIMQIETNPSEPVGTLAKTSPRTWDVKEKSVKEAGKEVGKEAHRFLGSSAGGDGEEIKKNASKNLDSLAKKLSGALAGDGDAESQGEARKKSVFA